MQPIARLAIAACLLLSVTACGKQYVRETPPADLLTRCPDVPELADNKADTLAVWGADLLDQYIDCAAKHDGLRKWHGKNLWVTQPWGHSRP